MSCIPSREQSPRIRQASRHPWKDESKARRQGRGARRLGVARPRTEASAELGVGVDVALVVSDGGRINSGAFVEFRGLLQAGHATQRQRWADKGGSSCERSQ
jgi:hypothetical protein